MALFLCSAGLSAHAQEMPRTVQVAGTLLKLNGKSVQRRLIFDIYQVGLYLQHPTKNAEEALHSDQVKQIRMRMSQDAPRKAVINAMRTGMTRSGVNLEPLGPRLNRLFSAMPDFKAGEQLFITYVPKRGTRLESKDGEGVTIPGKDFADAIFTIWLGSDPGVARVKRELLGN